MGFYLDVEQEDHRSGCTSVLGCSQRRWVSTLLLFIFIANLYCSVIATLTNGPATPEVRALPKHKKNPEVGTKKTVYSSKIIIEQEDARSFEDQEEVRYVGRLSRWWLMQVSDYTHGLG